MINKYVKFSVIVDGNDNKLEGIGFIEDKVRIPYKSNKDSENYIGVDYYSLRDVTTNKIYTVNVASIIEVLPNYEEDSKKLGREFRIFVECIYQALKKDTRSFNIAVSRYHSLRKNYTVDVNDGNIKFKIKHENTEKDEK